jgi:serine protease DegS
VKQELSTFIWPALVGVLAAALILDKWVLEPQEAMNVPASGGYRNAVALATPSVVNIYTAKLVDARTTPRCSVGYFPIAAVASASSARWAPASFSVQPDIL